MSKPTTVILAAGKGTRMKSERPKVLHTLAGKPMLRYVIDLARVSAGGKIIIVVGYGAGEVMHAFEKDKGLSFVIQKPQLGTAHAVLSARKAMGASPGTILILGSDAPLVTPESIRALLFLHRTEKPFVTFLTAIVPDPSGYGRVVRDSEGEILRIVEEKDAAPEVLEIKEVNGGIYAVEADFLFFALKKIRRTNAQKEYYLPDIIRLAREYARGASAGRRPNRREGALGLVADDPREIMGVNTRADLARAEAIIRRGIVDTLMLNGVTVIDPPSVMVDAGVTIGNDTTLFPQCAVRGDTHIGKGCVLEPGAIVSDSVIHDVAVVRAYSVIEESTLGKGAVVGPFVHLRPGSVIENGARVGNFVEVKQSRIGRGSKALHLTYLGDATLGRNVNIGAGTITCNYDGFKKYRTTIEDNVLIGSDTMLVAPITVGKGAVTGAGSSITKNVPAGSLAVARAQQVNITGFRKKLEKRYQKKSH